LPKNRAGNLSTKSQPDHGWLFYCLQSWEYYNPAMIEWVIKNKEWLFSGVGIAILVGVWRLISYLRSKKEPPCPTQFAIIPTQTPVTKELEGRKELTRATREERRKSVVALEDINKMLDDTPPLQLENAKKHYLGIRVKCNTTLGHVRKVEDKDDLVTVLLVSEKGNHLISTAVPLSKYPELALLRKNHKVATEGTISGIDILDNAEKGVSSIRLGSKHHQTQL
jgi:hypothetical protein